MSRCCCDFKSNWPFVPSSLLAVKFPRRKKNGDWRRPCEKLHSLHWWVEKIKSESSRVKERHDWWTSISPNWLEYDESKWEHQSSGHDDSQLFWCDWKGWTGQYQASPNSCDNGSD